MGRFGARLQREREMRGITLEEIAQATKISTRSLRALEEEDFARLPGGIFNRGFVRSYVRYLGIDEEQAVADYEAALQQIGSPDGEDQTPAVVAPPKKAAGTRPTILAGIVLCALIAAVASRYLQHSKAQNQPARTGAERREALPENDPAPSLPQEPGPAAASPKTDSDAATGASRPLPSKAEFEVRLHALEDSWVEITSDGEAVMNGTLAAGTEKTLRARREIRLTAGNAGGIEAFHDGKQLPALGKSKSVRTVVFTPEGVN